MYETVPIDKDSAFVAFRGGDVCSLAPTQCAFPCHLTAAGTLRWLCSDLILPSSSSQLSDVRFLMRQKDNLHQGDESVDPRSAASGIPAWSRPDVGSWFLTPLFSPLLLEGNALFGATVRDAEGCWQVTTQR